LPQTNSAQTRFGANTGGSLARRWLRPASSSARRDYFKPREHTLQALEVIQVVPRYVAKADHARPHMLQRFVEVAISANSAGTSAGSIR